MPGTGEDGAASTSSTVSRAICNRASRSSACDNSSERPAACSRSRSAWPSTSTRLASNASINDGTPHPPSLSTRTPHGGLDPGDGRSRHDQPHPEPLRITPTRHPQKICTQSRYSGLTLYQILDALQDTRRCGTGTCTSCRQPLPTTVRTTQDQERPDGVLLASARTGQYGPSHRLYAAQNVQPHTLRPGRPTNNGPMQEVSLEFQLGAPGDDLDVEFNIDVGAYDCDAAGQHRLPVDGVVLAV